MGTNTARSSEDGAVRRRIGLLRRTQHGFMYVQYNSYRTCMVLYCTLMRGPNRLDGETGRAGRPKGRARSLWGTRLEVLLQQKWNLEA